MAVVNSIDKGGGFGVCQVVPVAVMDSINNGGVFCVGTGSNRDCGG